MAHALDLTLERSLVVATLDCLHRRAREGVAPPAHLRLQRAAEALDEARAELECLSREDTPPDEEGVSLCQPA
jgi:hypothetical protein